MHLVDSLREIKEQSYQIVSARTTKACILSRVPEIWALLCQSVSQSVCLSDGAASALTPSLHAHAAKCIRARGRTEAHESLDAHGHEANTRAEE
jgi:hypothetical protein